MMQMHTSTETDDNNTTLWLNKYLQLYLRAESGYHRRIISELHCPREQQRRASITFHAGTLCLKTEPAPKYLLFECHSDQK